MIHALQLFSTRKVSIKNVRRQRLLRFKKFVIIAIFLIFKIFWKFLNWSAHDIENLSDWGKLFNYYFSRLWNIQQQQLNYFSLVSARLTLIVDKNESLKMSVCIINTLPLIFFILMNKPDELAKLSSGLSH